MEGIRRSVLDSGLRVVTEALPELRSVTIGVWVGTGSRDETDVQSGASHFLEHPTKIPSRTRSQLCARTPSSSKPTVAKPYSTVRSAVTFITVEP